jgi:hypothetical protein
MRTVISLLATLILSISGYAQSVDREIWENGYYVDEFGESTGIRFISNKEYLVGTFSNSATEGSRLNVLLIINAPTLSYIQLFEYGGTNPVKAFRKTDYDIYIQDNKGERHQIEGYNLSSDRIVLTVSNAQTLHNILLKGGTVKFYVSEYGTQNKYRFQINNADGYALAYEKYLQLN